jgi:hypothetical protein
VWAALTRVMAVLLCFRWLPFCVLVATTLASVVADVGDSDAARTAAENKLEAFAAWFDDNGGVLHGMAGARVTGRTLLYQVVWRLRLTDAVAMETVPTSEGWRYRLVTIRRVPSHQVRPVDAVSGLTRGP